MSDDKLNIPVVMNPDLVNALVNYMYSRPYGEVAGLINGIMDSVNKSIKDKQNSDKKLKEELVETYDLHAVDANND